MSYTRMPASRRSVVRGALWSAPAVVMVTAAPAFASSLVAVTGTLDAPVTDGRVTFSHGTFENTTNKPMTITMTWTMGGPTPYKNAFYVGGNDDGVIDADGLDRHRDRDAGHLHHHTGGRSDFPGRDLQRHGEERRQPDRDMCVQRQCQRGLDDAVRRSPALIRRCGRRAPRATIVLDPPTARR